MIPDDTYDTNMIYDANIHKSNIWDPTLCNSQQENKVPAKDKIPT